MPDGTEVDWNWATVEELAKILTVDANGNDATSPDFDKTDIVQYGFSFQWQTDLRYIGSYLGGAAPLAGDRWQDGHGSGVVGGGVEVVAQCHVGRHPDRTDRPGSGGA